MDKKKPEKSKKSKVVPTPPRTTLSVPKPNFKYVQVVIKGTSPYVQEKFSEKAMGKMRTAQEAGGTAKTRRVREPRNFDEDYELAMYHLPDGANGIPASAFRSAMISACRTVGIVMTRAKLAVFVEPDGFDDTDAKPLVRFTKGEPEQFVQALTNDNGGTDLRVRPKWAEGWEAKLDIRYDADMLTAEDTMNLLQRAGQQVGIGAGRPDSRKCAGVGWGLFTIVED